jgi:hypothetical protein
VEAYVALYDTQAVRLHAYCWSLIGDTAPAAVRDVFTAATYPDMARRKGARHDALPDRIWLYRRARAECLRRGPVTVMAGRDPLLRAAARLRADQRELLVLAADLPPNGMAHVLGIPPARAIQLVTAAHGRLEQAVLKVLLADPATAAHEDVIAAFERGALGVLLARRAPAPPAGMREAIVSTMTRQRAPLVVISPQPKATAQRDGERKGRPAARHARAAAPVIGVAAACAAAVVGAMAAGATLNFDASPAGGGQGALAPSTAEHSRGGQTPQGGQPGSAAQPGNGEVPVAHVSPSASATQPADTPPSDAPAPAETNAPAAEAPSSSSSPSPDSQRQSAEPDPSSATPSGSGSASPSDSSTPSPTPSKSHSGGGGGGGLLPDLPILGKVLGDTLGG